MNAGNSVNIMRLLGDVVHQNSSAFLNRPTSDALAHFHANPLCYFREMANLKPETQLLRALVQQKDRKNFVIYHALHHLGHVLQERVEIKRGVEHVSSFMKQCLNVHALWWERCSHRVHP